MTNEGAERAIATSALIVAGIYIFRKLVEPANVATTVKSGNKGAQLVGLGPVPPIGTFITGWGVTFIVISIMASMAPGLGGAFAILVAATDVLGNGAALASDINLKLGGGTGIEELDLSGIPKSTAAQLAVLPKVTHPTQDPTGVTVLVDGRPVHIDSGNIAP